MKLIGAVFIACLLIGCDLRPFLDDATIEKIVKANNELNIQNRSGQNITKLTIKRGNDTVLTMKDVKDDGSTRGVFIVCRQEETQMVALCAYLPSGQVIATNFLAAVSPKNMQVFDVEIDKALVFHVTVRTK